MVRRMTRVRGHRRTISRAASMPFNSGMPTSTIATSGFPASAILIASWPLVASASTSKPAPCNKARRPSRTTRWSSARRTRSGISQLQGNRDVDPRSLAGRGGDLDDAAGGLHAVADSRQAQPVLAVPLAHHTHVESHAVVADRALQTAALLAHDHAAPAGLRMPGHVGERFLDEPVDGRGDDARA